MRKPAFLMAPLILFGLVPIGAWVWTASVFVEFSRHPEGRKGGDAAAIMFLIVLVFIPALIGGIMIVTGGGLLVRKPRIARIVASVGTGIVLVWGVAALFFVREAPLAVWVGTIAYLLVLCGLVAWSWRSYSPPAEPGGAVVGQHMPK
ncbi:MAG TPA: hypothetical protein VIF14_11890 [Alphaproteobacteria bacterium]|jgi:hypothetical protein